MERKRLLESTLIIVLILSGNILDFTDLFIDTEFIIFNELQSMCSEFRTLGLAILAYKYIPFENLKTKAFSLMLAIWAVITIIHNNFYDMTPTTLSYTLYSCYLLWIVRIALINIYCNHSDGYTKAELKALEESGVAINILLPVNTWRGLVQVLLLPWVNPLYETRLLVAGHKITYIKNKVFTQEDFNYKYINELISRGYKIRFTNNYKKKLVDGLIGKKLILGFRDCRKLEL